MFDPQDDDERGPGDRGPEAPDAASPRDHTAAPDAPSPRGHAAANAPHIPTPPIDAPHTPTPDHHELSDGDVHAGAGDERLRGLALAVALDGIDPLDADASALVDTSAAWSRVVAWATARRAEVVAVLAERAAEVAREAGQDNHWADGRHAVATELAMAEGITRQSAERLVRGASLLNGMLACTGEALEAGDLSPAKADIIVDGLVDTPFPVAWAVEERVLPHAHSWTPPELVRQVQRALVTVDPHEAERRARRAVDHRRVCRPRARADGMASIFAVLPAADAIAIDLALDTAARAAKQMAGEHRTLDQLRADLLAGVGIDALRTGTLPGTHLDAAAAVVPSWETVAADTGVGTDPPGGRLGTSQGGTGAGHGTAGGHGTGVPLARTGGRPVQVHVTVPLSTLMGGDEPGDLAGYGPIDPATARALAWGGTWRRIVTDPLTGTVLDVGRTTYRPPAALADLIRARDRTCVRPGCGTPARSCELDHLVPWEHEGETSLANLASECKQDHRHKSLGDFTVNLLPDGVFEWTSRLTDRTYRRETDGRITAIKHLTPEGAPPPPPPPPPPPRHLDGDPPPF